MLIHTLLRALAHAIPSARHPALSPPPVVHFHSSFRKSASYPPWDTSFKLKAIIVRSQ